VACWSVRAEGADCFGLTPPLLQETNSRSALPKITIAKTVNNNNNNNNNNNEYNNEYKVNVIKNKRKKSTSLSL